MSGYSLPINLLALFVSLGSELTEDESDLHVFAVAAFTALSVCVCVCVHVCVCVCACVHAWLLTCAGFSQSLEVGMRPQILHNAARQLDLQNLT